MIDPIIKSFVQNYLEEYEINPEGYTTDFEKFANYCIFLPHSNMEHSFDVDSVHVGQPCDTGLDGVGILVNGVLVNSRDDIDVEVDNNRNLTVRFIFLQAKTKANILATDILKTFDAVTDIFSDYLDEEPSSKRSQKIQDKAELIKYLLGSYSKQIRQEIECHIYYVTTLTKDLSQATNNKIDKKISKMEDELRFLSPVQFRVWKRNDLEKFYRNTQRQVEVVVKVEDVIELSESVEGVKQAYVATVKFPEFKKLIVDDQDNLRSFVFYENIRGYLGENKVNQDIKKTIESNDFKKFSILNNGITVLCKNIKLEKVTTYRLTDFQIVNGCQTSHVLYHARHSENINHIVIPIKLIETDEDRIRNDIIKATNHQTEVPKELLLALSDFTRRLESYYDSHYDSQEQNRLHYERRPGQYYAQQVVKKRVINILGQIKVFAAMFLDLPHSVRYKKLLVDKIGKDIFVESHSPKPYYASALTSYKLENFSKKEGILKIDNKATVKYHIMMVFKYLSAKSQCPKCTDHRNIDKYCDQILTVLNDEDRALKLFIKSQSVVFDAAEKQLKLSKKTLDDKEEVRALFKQVSFTDRILTDLNAHNDNIAKKRMESISKGQISFI